jgi:hypothetical protein
MPPIQRKIKTIRFLEKKGIPYYLYLPCIEPEEETELRTPEEVGIRMLCLYSVIGTAYDHTDTSYKDYLKRYRLWRYLTPDELSFITNPEPDQIDCNFFTWRVEALFVLMWAVNLFIRMPFPARQTVNEKIIEKFSSFKKSPRPFIRSLKLRSKSQILDKSDLIYRLHWACRQAEIDDDPPPPGVDHDVVIEWHHAINWGTKYHYSDSELNWDRFPTDT